LVPAAPALPLHVPAGKHLGRPAGRCAGPSCTALPPDRREGPPSPQAATRAADPPGHRTRRNPMNPISVTVTGRLGDDPRSFTTRDGTDGVELRLALDIPARGSGDSITRWVKVTAFGLLATRTAASVRKGDRVTVLADDLTAEAWAATTNGDPRPGRRPHPPHRSPPPRAGHHPPPALPVPSRSAPSGMEGTTDELPPRPAARLRHADLPGRTRRPADGQAAGRPGPRRGDCLDQVWRRPRRRSRRPGPRPC